MKNMKISSIPYKVNNGVLRVDTRLGPYEDRSGSFYYSPRWTAITLIERFTRRERESVYLYIKKAQLVKLQQFLQDFESWVTSRIQEAQL